MSRKIKILAILETMSYNDKVSNDTPADNGDNDDNKDNNDSHNLNNSNNDNGVITVVMRSVTIVVY